MLHTANPNQNWLLRPNGLIPDQGLSQNSPFRTMNYGTAPFTDLRNPLQHHLSNRPLQGGIAQNLYNQTNGVKWSPDVVQNTSSPVQRLGALNEPVIFPGRQAHVNLASGSNAILNTPTLPSQPKKVLEEYNLRTGEHFVDPSASPRAGTSHASPSLGNAHAAPVSILKNPHGTPQLTTQRSPRFVNRPAPLEIPSTPQLQTVTQTHTATPSAANLTSSPHSSEIPNRDRGIERGLPLGSAVIDRVYTSGAYQSSGLSPSYQSIPLSSPASTSSLSPAYSDHYNPLSKSSPPAATRPISYHSGPLSVAITSGTSRVGRAVLRELNMSTVSSFPYQQSPSTLNLVVKAGVHNSVKAQSSPELNYASAMSPVDAYNPISLGGLFQGADKALIIPAHHENRVDQAMRMINAAQLAGVKHCVLISYMGSELDTSMISRQFRLIERHLENSGMAWTHLRCAFFMENLLDLSEEVRSSRRITLPTGKDRWAPVAIDDVARVAALVLKSEGHEYKIYEITGPEALNGKEIASAMGSVFGTRIKYRKESERKTRSRLRSQGMTDWQIEGHMDMFRALHENRSNRIAYDGPMLTGAQTHLRDWLQMHRGFFGA